MGDEEEEMSEKRRRDEVWSVYVGGRVIYMKLN